MPVMSTAMEHLAVPDFWPLHIGQRIMLVTKEEAAQADACAFPEYLPSPQVLRVIFNEQSLADKEKLSRLKRGLQLRVPGPDLEHEASGWMLLQLEIPTPEKAFTTVFGGELAATPAGRRLELEFDAEVEEGSVRRGVQQ